MERNYANKKNMKWQLTTATSLERRRRWPPDTGVAAATELVCQKFFFLEFFAPKILFA